VRARGVAFAAAALVALACGGKKPPVAASTEPEETDAGAEEPSDAAPAEAHGKSHGAPHWKYTGEEGPDHWGDLSPEWSACKAGKQQSPIDLPKAGGKSKGAAALKMTYEPVPLAITNNGHTLQVASAGGASSVTIGGEKYDLAQFHFHAPSEHTVAGKPFDMELHLVHKNAAGKLAVVGLLLKKGKENKVLKALFDAAPDEVTKEPKAVQGATIDVGALVTKKQSYYSYPGSLTTPPCSEGVTWVVLSAPGEASEAQIAKLSAAVKGTSNRPVQPVGDRTVFQFHP
jgi:carbonic anhydrase